MLLAPLYFVEQLVTGILKHSGYLKTPPFISILHGCSVVQEVNCDKFMTCFEHYAKNARLTTSPEAVRG